ncbi:zinc/manganese transport system substrate-binding protein [Microbacteriaceae bacterium SG_E_30_P1]|uniref:Zinc/manganese transport system substrate-binding protein n=1 Tax=Antiquaquibacter oligotrophicus TaxID=2880260 RepID=A0ABT6KQZ4_9MICO|nr:zinc ABC transporter substrate-binding protein [Antiquaquibacter oligotrophicus]MDH6182401.1 zinc/manganese transport system substrate-binding protein [Antiquaquibacter oligotrophicus]UDF14627.1 zinc ABC transporter substrate-binding protein [Antiquaquibacter oligotrophicus]
MKRLPLGVIAVTALALAGCAASPTPDAAPESDGPAVVASTNVYGNIASAVGGDLIEVSNIISRDDQDPHSFEASARDQLLVSEADLVILNGGGYDPFMEQLISGSDTTAPVLNAVELSGLLGDDHADDDHTEDDHAEEEHAEDDGHDHIEGFNEHVWYSFPAMVNLTTEIAHELGEIDPDNAATYTSNADTFIGKLNELQAEADVLAESLAGKGAAMTEPVPGYLLDAVGLVNLTPPDFTEAIEEGADVPPLALQETLDLISSGSVVMLGYNEQTESPETERVEEAADAADIPVISFTETLPSGLDYITWMQRYNLGEIRTQLT